MYLHVVMGYSGEGAEETRDKRTKSVLLSDLKDLVPKKPAVTRMLC